MKKILLFFAFVLMGGAQTMAAVRDGNAPTRQKSGVSAPVSPQRIASTTSGSGRGAAARTTTLPAVTTRSASTPVPSQTARPTAASRAAATPARATRAASSAADANNTNTSRRAAVSRTAPAAKNVVARAAIDDAASTSVSETRTGAEYEKCKAAYFTCMDQFCQLKNDDYRRCSCSDRVYKLAEVRDTMTAAGQELTTFNENLEAVGLTAAQAAAMRTASEGENALTSDKSASKALLQAIMNSIRGTDTTVGGKFSDLNSINLAFDTANAFGTTHAGQAIAAYNGQALYSAVYPQCRSAVRADCTDAALQRAITAYLMAVEQDCNTVQTAIENTQKQMKSAIRESSAMLDLARVENRQKHNSSDIATCINLVETAVLSEEVCGSGYHRCLDNGEFIDISTGAPIAGVERFYELENLLTFKNGVNNADQQLSKIPSNRTFVQNFEKRTKKFAKDALDTCVENADTVWAEYLDKAMLDIYYAQKAKVSEIKQGCFDFVSTCYMNGDKSITAAMAELTGDSAIVLQPDKLALTTAMCQEYVNSCDNMFDGNIVRDYVQNRQDTDTLTACRAIVKQCFDKFGGNGYQNFYYPYSGLITKGQATDWFTLFEISDTGTYTLTGTDGAPLTHDGKPILANLKSECARQLSEISSCSSPEMLTKAFGGFDAAKIERITIDQTSIDKFNPDTGEISYGTLKMQDIDNKNVAIMNIRGTRPTGVATELYNQIIDTLSTQCTNIQGRFVEVQNIDTSLYDQNNYCISKFGGKSTISTTSKYGNPPLAEIYSIFKDENMCPRDYDLNIDTKSWGACLCWENGGRRSKNGTSPACKNIIPTQKEIISEGKCDGAERYEKLDDFPPVENWCTQTEINQSTNQVCPIYGHISPDNKGCTASWGTTGKDSGFLDNLPDGITK